MDKQTADALEASIAHWAENMTAEKFEDASTSYMNCALCLEFDDGCDGCPVSKRTGKDECFGTPYYRAHSALRLWGENGEARDTFHAAAKKMHDFLVSLRETVDG
jgi:hypothetical protein